MIEDGHFFDILYVFAHANDHRAGVCTFPRSYDIRCFFFFFSLPGAELTVTCKTKNNQPGSPDIGDFGGLSNH